MQKFVLKYYYAAYIHNNAKFQGSVDTLLPGVMDNLKSFVSTRALTCHCALQSISPGKDSGMDPSNDKYMQSLADYVIAEIKDEYHFGNKAYEGKVMKKGNAVFFNTAKDILQKIEAENFKFVEKNLNRLRPLKLGRN